MKKTLITSVLAIALVLCSVCALVLTVEAETPEPELRIKYCNLSFRDSICIKYAVESNVSDVKLLIWTDPEAEYIIGTQDDEITDWYEDTIGGAPYKVFDYTKIVAKKMADVVYARAYTRAGGVDYYSKVEKYSVLQYAYNKLGKTGTASTNEELKQLLTDMLAYGASAQKYLDDYKADRLATADWYQVKVTEGALDDGCTHGLYLPEDKVTLIATEQDTSGNTFSHWEDSNGNEVATTAIYELTVGTANEVYTPIYTAPSSEGLEFTSNGDGTCYVSGIGTCTDTDIIIPATSPEGDRVTGIGDYAFDYCSRLTSITIPNGVTSIGAYAFRNCISIASITIPNSVTSIGGCAFYYCTALTSITIPDGVMSIGNNTFYNCSSLASITIPNSVTSIGGMAFYYCTALTSITIPDSVTSIGTSAFNTCRSLTSIIIPNSVTSIGYQAFRDCPKLTSITLPNKLTLIDHEMFQNCSSLKSITIPSSVTRIGAGVFKGCSALSSITFEDTSTWYRTTNDTNWENFTGGTSTSVEEASTNATRFRDSYYYLYDRWYKK